MQQRLTIPDSEIPNTDPDTLVFCFTPWVQKIALRYMNALERTGAGAVIDTDDLFQVGTLGLLRAQKLYDPAGGASFLNYSQFHIRAAMIREINKCRPRLALGAFVSLDKPISDDGDDTIMDIIPDKSIIPFDESIIAEETRNETSNQVRAALDRMKSDKQRSAVSLVWMEGKTREQAADEMNMKIGAFYSLEKYGRSTLRRDYRLRKYAQYIMPSFNVGIAKFRNSWTSATEAAAIWLIEHYPDEQYPEYIRRKDAVAEDLDTGCHWSPAQTIAQMKRRMNERATVANS